MAPMAQLIIILGTLVFWLCAVAEVRLHWDRAEQVHLYNLMVQAHQIQADQNLQLDMAAEEEDLQKPEQVEQFSSMNSPHRI